MIRILASIIFVWAATFASSSPAGADPDPKSLALVPVDGPLAGEVVYAASHALLIGINNYPNLHVDHQLRWAVNDVQQLRAILVDNYGFPAEHVTVLTDEGATKENIEKELVSLGNEGTIGPDDRVLIYFSGHGQTVNVPGGGELGFLIPSDARIDLADAENASPYMSTCLRMDKMWSMADVSPAKHVLLLADACYSGFFSQARGGGGDDIGPDLMRKLVSARARQVITAGRRGEQAFEKSEYGHGAFTYELLEYLRAEASEPGAAFMASELFANLQKSVGNETQGKQNPQLVNFDTEGQFLFITDDEPAAPALAGVPTVTLTQSSQPTTGLANQSTSPARPKKLRVAVMDVDAKAIANVPEAFDQDLTALLSYRLAEESDLDRVTVLEQKDIAAIRQARALLGGESDPIVDLAVMVAVTHCGVEEKDVVSKVGKVFGGKLGRWGKKAAGSVSAGVRQSVVVMDVRVLDPNSGRTVTSFPIEVKETDPSLEVDLDFTQILSDFALSKDFFSANPVGRGLSKAFDVAVPRLVNVVNNVSR